MRITRLFLTVAFIFPFAAAAQTVQYYKVSSGTGFFVNRQYVITNAHVVNGCSKVIIKGAVPEHTADVKVLDAERDLALLETDQPPQEFAPLRFDIDGLKPGDKVLVVGYPGEAGARGEYKVAEAQVQPLKVDEGGKEGSFYITDVLEHGNSGGPVFDTSGNVIGVVVAKATLSIQNAQTHEQIAEQHAGVVISLAMLTDFLNNHGVYVQWNGSGSLYTDSYLEDRAKDYIVNVQCRTLTDRPLANSQAQ